MDVLKIVNCDENSLLIIIIDHFNSLNSGLSSKIVINENNQIYNSNIFNNLNRTY